MKSFAFKILGNQKIDLGKVFQSHLPGYSLIHRNGTDILLSDVLSLMTGSNMLNVIILSTKDNRNYDVDLIAGGGKEGFLIQHDWWAESSGLEAMSDAIEEICDIHNLTIIRPGQSYY